MTLVPRTRVLRFLLRHVAAVWLAVPGFAQDDVSRPKGTVSTDAPAKEVDAAIAAATAELLALLATTMPDRSGDGVREPSVAIDEERRQESLQRCSAKLRQLPDEVAKGVYTELLTTFAPDPDESPHRTVVTIDLAAAFDGSGSTQPPPAARMTRVLRACDIVALLRLPPWMPDDAQLRLLARMVTARCEVSPEADPAGDVLVDRCAALAAESRELRDRVIRLLLPSWPPALAHCLPPYGGLAAQQDAALLIGHQASFTFVGEVRPALTTQLAVHRRILELLSEPTSAPLFRNREGLLRHQLLVGVELAARAHVADRRSLFEFVAARGHVAEFGAAALDRAAVGILSEFVQWLDCRDERDRSLQRRLATAVGWKWCEIARAVQRDEERAHLTVQPGYSGSDPRLDAYWTDAELLAEIASVRLDYAIQERDFARALDLVVASKSLGTSTSDRLAKRYFAAWGDSRDPEPYFKSIAANGRPAEGMTRPADAQECAIAELTEAWTRVRGLRGSAALLDAAFDQLLRVYSLTEVYRVEDFERVFGPFDEWTARQIESFAERAQARLEKCWTKWKLQVRAATGRSEAQHALEVARAIGVIDRLGSRYADLEPSFAWKGSVWRSDAWGTWAGFARQSKAEANQHAERQKTAIAFANQALAAYCELRSNDRTKRSIDPLLACFWSLVDGSQSVAPEVLDEMSRSIAALGPAEETWHQDALAVETVGEIASAAPHEKYFLAKGFVQLLADRRDLGYARELIDRCDRFRGDVRVHVAIDGATDVGVGRPFGIRVSFHYRERAMTATRGFGRYLRNETQEEVGTESSPIFYRDDLESGIRVLLASRFHLDAVVLARPDALPKRLAGSEAGWFETNIAYVIARARDRSVDAIPPLSFDLDLERRGDKVVLAVDSNLVPIRATVESSARRPVADLRVTQTLDERELDKGRLAVAVQVKAVGVPPGIDRLLRLPEGPYRIDRIVDEKLSVSGLDPTGAPLVELTADLLIDASVAGPSDPFVFPVVSSEPAQDVQMEWRRYPMTALETGLESIPARVALRGSRPRVPTTLFWWIGGAALLVGAGFALRRWMPRRRTLQRAPIDLPPTTDGPSVSLFLRRIAADHAVQWSPEDQIALHEDLERVERVAFSGTEDVAVDFDVVARRWSERARTRRGVRAG